MSLTKATIQVIVYSLFFILSNGCSFTGNGALTTPNDPQQPDPGSPVSGGQSFDRNCEVSTLGVDIFFEKLDAQPFYGAEFGIPWTNVQNPSFTARLHDSNDQGPNGTGCIVGYIDQWVIPNLVVVNGYVSAQCDVAPLLPGIHEFKFVFLGVTGMEVSVPMVLTWRFYYENTPPQATGILANDSSPTHYALFFDKPIERDTAEDPVKWVINGQHGLVDHVDIQNGGNTADIYFGPGIPPLNNRYFPVDLFYEDPRGMAGMMIPPQIPGGPPPGRSHPLGPCNCEVEEVCPQKSHTYREHEENAISVEWRLPQINPCRFSIIYRIQSRRNWNANPYDPEYIILKDDDKERRDQWDPVTVYSSALLVSLCAEYRFFNEWDWDFTGEIWSDCGGGPPQKKFSFAETFITIDTVNPHFESEPQVMLGPQAADWLQGKADSWGANAIKGPMFDTTLAMLRAVPCRYFCVAGAEDVVEDDGIHNLAWDFPAWTLEKCQVQPPQDVAWGLDFGWLLRIDKPPMAGAEVVVPWCCGSYEQDGDPFNELEYAVFDVTGILIDPQYRGFQLMIQDDFNDGVTGYGNWHRSETLALNNLNLFPDSFEWINPKTNTVERYVQPEALSGLFDIISEPTTISNPMWMQYTYPHGYPPNLYRFSIKPSCNVVVTAYIDEYHSVSPGSWGISGNGTNVDFLHGATSWKDFLIPINRFVPADYKEPQCNNDPYGASILAPFTARNWVLNNQDYSPVFATTYYGQSANANPDPRSGNGFGGVYSGDAADFLPIYPIMGTELPGSYDYYRFTSDGRQWYFLDAIQGNVNISIPEMHGIPPKFYDVTDYCPDYPGALQMPGEDQLETGRYPLYPPPGIYEMALKLFFPSLGIYTVVSLGDLTVDYQSPVIHDPDNTPKPDEGSVYHALSFHNLCPDITTEWPDFSWNNDLAVCPDWGKAIFGYNNPGWLGNFGHDEGTIMPGPFISATPYHNIYEYMGHTSNLFYIFNSIKLDNLGFEFSQMQTNVYDLVVLRACYTTKNHPQILTGPIVNNALSHFNARVKVGWSGETWLGATRWNDYFHDYLRREDVPGSWNCYALAADKATRAVMWTTYEDDPYDSEEYIQGETKEITVYPMIYFDNQYYFVNPYHPGGFLVLLPQNSSGRRTLAQALGCNE